MTVPIRIWSTSLPSFALRPNPSLKLTRYGTQRKAGVQE